MRAPNRLLTMATVALLALAGLTGCGGGGNGDGAAAETEGSCDGTTATGSMPGNEDFEAVDAVAVSLADGRAFTTYLTDFELDHDDVSPYSTPTVPTDGSMFIVALTAFNADVDELEPVAVGDEIEHTTDFQTMTFVIQGEIGGEAAYLGQDAEGTLRVTAVGDRFCAVVEYSDTEKSLSGSFEAPVLEG